MIIITVIKVVGLRFVFSAIIIFDPLNHTKDRDKSKTKTILLTDVSWIETVPRREGDSISYITG